MGKRKLHGRAYHQCDWTGFPMRNSNCYMPTWHKGPGGKLCKRGSYCNWESVMAHARHRLVVEKLITEEEHTRIREHVEQVCGGALEGVEQHHFSFLEHFKDETEAWTPVSDVPLNRSMQEYHAKCCETVEEVTAVKVAASGEVFELIMDPHDGKFCFEQYVARPYMLQGGEHGLASFQSLRRGNKSKDRELTVFYWPFKNGLPFNNTASTLFKMQIYGDALVVQQTNEACFMPRNRYVHFTRQAFDEAFTKKRKRAPAEAPALTEVEYSDLKEEMRSSLAGFEQTISSSAQRPQELARAATMPAPSASELTEVARLLGHDPEKMQRLEARLTAPTSPSGARSAAAAD